MRFIANPASVKLVDRTARLFPEFFQGQPVALNPELIEMERAGFAKLLDNDSDSSLILGGEASGRIKDMPKVSDLIDRIVNDASEILSRLPTYVQS